MLESQPSGRLLLLPFCPTALPIPGDQLGADRELERGEFTVRGCSFRSVSSSTLLLISDSEEPSLPGVRPGAGGTGWRWARVFSLCRSALSALFLCPVPPCS